MIINAEGVLAPFSLAPCSLEPCSLAPCFLAPCSLAPCCKGLLCVQGPHILPFCLITNDNQCRGSLHCSLAPCSLGERCTRAGDQKKEYVPGSFLGLEFQNLQFWNRIGQASNSSKSNSIQI